MSTLVLTVSLISAYVSLGAMTFCIQSVWAIREMVSSRRPTKIREMWIMLIKSLVWFAYWPHFLYRRWS